MKISHVNIVRHFYAFFFFFFVNTKTILKFSDRPKMAYTSALPERTTTRVVAWIRLTIPTPPPPAAAIDITFTSTPNPGRGIDINYVFENRLIYSERHGGANDYNDYNLFSCERCD